MEKNEKLELLKETLLEMIEQNDYCIKNSVYKLIAEELKIKNNAYKTVLSLIDLLI